MKYVVVINLTVIFANIQCGVVKTLVETAAGEVQKVAGFIEHIADDGNAFSRQNVMDQAIKIISNASQLIENNINKTVSTEIKIDKPQNFNISEHNPDNVRLQVNVDINVITKYKQNVLVNNLTATDYNNDNDIITTYTTINPETQANAMPSIVENTTNSEVNTTVVIEQTVNTNVLFPGPTYRPNITYTGDVVVLKTNYNKATRDEFLFPDKNSNNATNDTTTSCPDGMVMTAKGYCLIPEKQVNEDRQYKEGSSTYSAFDVQCLNSHQRAWDSSCQPVIMDDAMA